MTTSSDFVTSVSCSPVNSVTAGLICLKWLDYIYVGCDGVLFHITDNAI